MKIDFIGITPHFLIQGKSSHQSLLGGLVSLLVGVAIFAGSCYFVNNLLGRNNYSVIVTQEKNSKSYISWSQTQFAVTLLDKLAEEIPDLDRIITITTLWSVNSYNRKEDGTLSYSTLLQPVEMQKCKIKENFGNDAHLWWDEKLINNSACFTPENPWNSTKTYGDPGYTGMTLWFGFCSNSTEKNNCYSVEESMQILSNVFILVRFKDFYFVHSQKGQAAKPYVYSDMVSVSSTVYKRIWYNFQNVDYINDEGLIFPSEETWSYDSLGNTREAIDLRSPDSNYVKGSFLTLSLNMHPMRLSYQRKYYKFQNMIADLGGLFRGVTFLAYVITHYIANKFYFKEIIDSNLHSMREEDQIIKEGTSSCLNNFIIQTGSNNNLAVPKNGKNCSKDPNDLKRLQSIPTGTFSHINFRQNKFLLRKPHQFFISWYQLTLPFCCVRRKGKWYDRISSFNSFRSIVESQLDVKNYIKVVNTVDKLCYCIAGTDLKKYIEDAINPWTIENFEKNSAPAECQKLKNEIRNNFFYLN